MERGIYDDGFVVVFFVVVEDGFDGGNIRVFFFGVFFFGGGFELVENVVDEGGDEVGIGFGGGDGLDGREYES